MFASLHNYSLPPLLLTTLFPAQYLNTTATLKSNNLFCFIIQRSDSLDYQDEKVQKSIAGFITAPYERPPSNPGLMGMSSGTGTSRDALPQSASASPVMGQGMDSAAPSAGSGTASKTQGKGGHHANGAERSGNQLLNTKGVAQVWGKKPEVPIPVPGNSKVSPPTVPAPVTATHTTAYPANPVYDQKDAKKEKESIEEIREPSEREKMALALFGGMKPTPSSSSSSSSSSAHKGGAVTAVSVSPTILIQPIPYKKPQSGSAGPDLALALTPLQTQTRTPDFMNLNPSPKHDSPFISSSSSSSSSSKPMNSNITNHINGNGTGSGSGSGMGIVASTSRTHSPNTPPLNPTMSSTAPVPLLVPVPSTPASSSSPTPSPSLPVLTPLKITTQYFGQLWSQVGTSDTESSDQPTLLEGKSSCQCGVTTLERLRAVLPSRYGHVESIPASQEAIFASLVMSSSSDVIQLLTPSPSLSPALPTPFVGNGLKTGEVNMVILIHIQLQVGNDTGTGTGKVDITVKSSSRDICASTIQSIISALATSS